MRLLKAERLSEKLCPRGLVSAGFGGVILPIKWGWCTFSGRSRGFAGLAVLRELESGEHPEVVREDRPSDAAFAGGKAFASAETAGKMVLEDRDACFDPTAARQSGAEGLIFPQAFLQLARIAGQRPLLISGAKVVFHSPG